MTKPRAEPGEHRDAAPLDSRTTDRHRSPGWARRLLPALAGIVAMVLAAVPAYARSDLTFPDAWLSLWTTFFVVGFALIALEGAFFMTERPIRGALPFVAAFVVTGAMAAIASRLASDDLAFTLAARVRAALAARPFPYWAARLIGAAGLFTFLYAVLGSAAWPHVRKYYEDPAHGLRLRVPSGRVVIALQMVRGLVTTVVLFPLITALPSPSMATVAALALLLMATMAIGPLTMSPRWPLALRVIHAVEISLFAILYSLVLCWLFVAPQSPS